MSRLQLISLRPRIVTSWHILLVAFEYSACSGTVCVRRNNQFLVSTRESLDHQMVNFHDLRRGRMENQLKNVSSACPNTHSSASLRACGSKRAAFQPLFSFWKKLQPPYGVCGYVNSQTSRASRGRSTYSRKGYWQYRLTASTSNQPHTTLHVSRCHTPRRQGALIGGLASWVSYS